MVDTQSRPHCDNNIDGDIRVDRMNMVFTFCDVVATIGNFIAASANNTLVISMFRSIVFFITRLDDFFFLSDDTFFFSPTVMR